MRQWTATHLAKLARKISIAAGKKGTDLPGQIAKKKKKNGKTTTFNLIGHTL